MANASFSWTAQMGDSNTRMSVDADNSFAKKGALYKGTNHMGKSVAFEPQRLYNFELQIVGLDALYTADKAGTGDYSVTTQNGSNSEFVHFGSAAERILVACSSFSVPDTTVGLIEIPHYNNTTKYAGKVDFGDATLVVEQFLGSFTEQIMTTWSRCVYDPRTQNIGYKNDYAKDMYVIEYDAKGGTPRVWKMENAWPSVLPGSNWDYSSQDRRQMSFNIRCDRCIPDYGIDTRTFGSLQDNALNSITTSSASTSSTGIGVALADGYATWTYDPETRTYINPNTGTSVSAFSD